MLSVLLLKSKLSEALKANNQSQKDIIRLILSENDKHNMKYGEPVNVQIEARTLESIVRKLLEGNAETAKFIKGSLHPELYKDKLNSLYAETYFLKSFLPQCMSKEELSGHLMEIRDLVKNAKNDGMAKGLVYKKIKEKGLVNLDPETVTDVIVEFRE